MTEGIVHVRSEGLAQQRARAARAWRRARELAHRGEHREALARFREAEDALLDAGLRRSALRVLRNRMHSLEMMGRYREAIDVADRCRSMLRAGDGARERARLDLQEANVHHLLHDRARAVALYRRARDVFEGAGDVVMAARIDVSRANILTCDGELREAESIYRHSRATLRDAGRPLRVAIVDSNLGLNLAFQGRYLEAIRAHQHARDAFERLGAGDRVSMVDLNLSDLYLDLNLTEEADRHSRRALESFRETGQEYAFALACLNRYFVESGRGGRKEENDPEALLSRARSLFQAQGASIWTAITDMHRASVRFASGQIDEARTEAETAWRTLRARGVGAYAAHARLLVARVEEADGRLEVAEGHYRAGIEDADRSGLDDLKARFLHGRGRIEEKRGRPEAAIASYDAAIEAIEKVRVRLRLDAFRTAFIEDKTVVYEDVVRLLLDRGRVDAALDRVERARSNALLDLLSEHLRLGSAGGRGGGSGGVPDTRLAGLREALNRLYVRSRELEHPGEVGAGADEQDLARKIRSCETAYGRRLRRIAVEEVGGRRFGETLGLPRPDPCEILGSLDAGTVVLEYAALGDEILLFLPGASGGTVLRNLASMREIEASLGEWREEMADIACLDPVFVRENAEALAAPALALLRGWERRLLEPAADRLEGADTLLVVPHGALHHLPFHAFFDGRRHAIERWNMFQVPGLHVFDLCRRRGRRRGGRPLVVGVAETDLPFVEEEIRVIADLLPGARILREESATVEAFREAAARASTIHLSCHGRYRRDNPLFSSLRLRNGELTAHDICDLDLSCDLVVLSACETGVSDVRPGDELMGLCRSFFLAGVPSLVVSLWPVSDRSTMRLMEYFYRSIRRGTAPHRALRGAQCRLLSEWPHPYFWAPFFTVGRG